MRPTLLRLYPHRTVSFGYKRFLYGCTKPDISRAFRYRYCTDEGKKTSARFGLLIGTLAVAVVSRNQSFVQDMSLDRQSRSVVFGDARFLEFGFAQMYFASLQPTQAGRHAAYGSENKTRHEK